MIFFLLLVFCWGICQYAKGRRRYGMMVFFFFISHGFFLVNESLLQKFPISKMADWAILYMLFIYIYNIKNKSFFKVEVPCCRWMLILFVWISIVFIITICFNLEFFSYAFKTYRLYFLFLSFYLLQDLSYGELQVLLKQISLVFFFTTVLYLIQPIFHIKTLQHAGGDYGNMIGEIRYRNIPYLDYFYVIYMTIMLKLSNIKSVFYYLCFVAAVILTQHRGVMLSYLFVMLLYLYLSKQVTKIFQYGVIGVVVLFLFGAFLTKRFGDNDDGHNVFEDIKSAVSLNLQELDVEEYNSEDGTFAFRIYILVERFQYLINHPNFFISGVGLRHELSPKTEMDFNFTLGSKRPDPSKGGWVMAQSCSSDLVWLTPLFRMGVVALILYIIVTVNFFVFFLKNMRLSELAMSTFLFYLLLILISFKNDHLFGGLQLFFLYAIMVLISRKNKLLNLSLDDENININLFEGIK